jgi:hypothetical protein
MKFIITLIFSLSFFLTLLFSQNEIEGRWHLVGYEDNVMYQFENDYRYTLYSTDGNFGDIDEAGGSPNPYTVADDIITMDLFFGIIVSYQMVFSCDGQVVEFRTIENDIIHSILFREGYNYIEGNCQCIDGEINDDDPCFIEECYAGEWFYLIIDCAEDFGVLCEGGLYIPPPEGVCCAECISFGDINYDFQISILDVIQTIHLILDDDYNEIVDMNYDVVINILDIIEIINIILD